MASARGITRSCYSRARASAIRSTFVPWTAPPPSPTILAAVTAPGEVAGAEDFSKLFTTERRGNEYPGMLGRFWANLRGEKGQNVSEYAVLLVLLLLIVVATVHAIGMNAQQVIDKVNTALHG